MHGVIIASLGSDYGSPVRIGLLTREYPPEVYGGAGVHVGSLVPQLRDLIDVAVRERVNGSDKVVPG